MNENGSQRVYEMEQVLKKQEESRTASKGANGGSQQGGQWGSQQENQWGASKGANGGANKKANREPTERMTTGWTAV